MTREVGEIFEFESKKLKVVESTGIICKRCYFYKYIGSCTLSEISNFIGNCISYNRKDKKNVFFKEIK